MLKNTGKLAGKTLFITGASRGIGKAIAQKAAKDGAKIVIAAKTAEPHPKLPGTIYTAAKEIESAGGRALPIIVDVRDESAVKNAVDAAVEEFGGIDILVNNASAISLTGTLETSMKTYDLMNQINSRGTYMVSKHCLPHLLKAENPHILNISPPLNMEPVWFKGHVAYTMAKYGMSMCVLGMAEEFKSKGVAVNALWPRTVVMTAALEMLLQSEAGRQSRKPEIMADAAYAIFCRDSKTYTGNFAIDDSVLKEEGITNFDEYAVDPKGELMPDLFLEEFSTDNLKSLQLSGSDSVPAESGVIDVISIFEGIQKIINKDLVSRMDAMFAFEMLDEGSSWFVDLKTGNGSFGEGEPPSPADATFKMKSDTFIEMFKGEITPTRAFMSGDLEISGDLSKAMSLEKFMSKVQSKL